MIGIFGFRFRVSFFINCFEMFFKKEEENEV